MGKTDVLLHGAPDVDIVFPRPTQRPVQAVALSFSESAMKDIIAAARTGDKSVELTFDKSGTTLRFGSNVGSATLNPAPFRHELYRSTEDAAQDLHFAGLIDHELTLESVRAGEVSAEDAFLAVKAKMDELTEAKKSRTTLYDPNYRPEPAKAKPGSRSKAPLKAMPKGSAMLQKDRAALAKQHAAMGLQSTANNRSQPARTLVPPAGSPPSRPQSSQSQQPPSTMALPQDERSRRQRAIRSPLLHLLAMGPCLERTMIRKLKVPREELDIWLQKFGRRDDSTGMWKLSDRGYKEVKPWEFAYRTLDREQVIKLAISAYDRLRLSRSDPLWQQLLPKEERDRGVCLSRLNLLAGPRPSAVSAGSASPLASASGEVVAAVAASAVAPRGKSKEQLALEKRLFAKKRPRVAPKADDPKKKAAAAKGTAAEKKKKAPTGKAAAAVAAPRSQEFVRSSDEDAIMAEAPAAVTTARKRKAAAAEVEEEKPTPKRTKTDAVAPKKEVKPKKDLKSKPKPKPQDRRDVVKDNTKNEMSNQSSPAMTSSAPTSQQHANSSFSVLNSSPPTTTTDGRSDQSGPLPNLSSPLANGSPPPPPPDLTSSSPPVTSESSPVLTNGHDTTTASSATAVAAPTVNGHVHDPVKEEEVLQLAREFRAVHDIYTELYTEVERMVPGTPGASVAKYEEVLRMHRWLEVRKAEIYARAHEVSED
ncbi:MAG: hypothetical protein M1823_005118 [Watsoniomyces obsoletus]|nr:MAG: hypothetical protein M1823_005118 [Watsoniomyces obsoletus]